MIDRRSFISSGLGAAGLLGANASRMFAAAAKLDSDAKPGPVVETAAGKVRGIEKPGVYTFRGVPYGASTAGDMRFLPAAKPTPWTGVRDAREFGLKAPQGPTGLRPEAAAEDRNEPMGEDCLVLNVWTGNVKSKKPVMMWLHGGGYAGGSAAYTIYDGTELARKHDVVVVGINHRLNVFGFLYLAELGNPKYAQSSNIGMMDIVAALEWVRDNIANFGGDPHNVTIFGQSGGGGKVSTLLAMPPANGLFHRAIVESGSTLRATPRDAAIKSTEAFMAKLGLQPNQVDEMQKMPMEQLLASIRGVQGLRLAPVVDGKTLPTHPFDPGAPEISANVPMIVGCNAEEGTFGANAQIDPIDDATLYTRVKQTLRGDDATADRMIALYRKTHPGITNIDLVLTLGSDAAVRTNAMTQAERKAALGKAPVYLYNFAWNSPVLEGKLKSMHTMEIPFVFDQVDEGKAMTGSGQDRYTLAGKMAGAWAAFARSGNPDHKGLPHWPAFDASKRATMIFNDECKVLNDPNHEERLALAEIVAAQPQG
jgi:para-nitrobenzyl esterase